MRIILDKSAVVGLHNDEVDSLDRYFFQVVPNILTNEILADLAKELDPKSPNRIAANTYRVSGNHGLTLNFRTRLFNSLIGNEIPMDGRFLASRETIVRTVSGSLATVVETPLEDEVLARWTRQEFSDDERAWAVKFREKMEQPLDSDLYLNNILAAGLTFNVPRSDEELFASVNALLSDRKMLPRLFAILARDFAIRPAELKQITDRWYREGRKTFEEFAPYAFYCLKAAFLVNLSLTNPTLFKADKKQNDKKDLEYCYYLPSTEVFATRDKKQRRIMSALARADQSVVDADELKKDLRRIAEAWSKLSREEKIAVNGQRGDAPPESAGSLVYELWKKHDGKINPSQLDKVADRKFIDNSLPVGQQVPFPISDFVKKKVEEIRFGQKLSPDELDELNRISNGENPGTMLLFNSKIDPARIVKWYPNLDVAAIETEIQNHLWLDPSEYRHLVFT